MKSNSGAAVELKSFLRPDWRGRIALSTNCRAGWSHPVILRTCCVLAVRKSELIFYHQSLRFRVFRSGASLGHEMRYAEAFLEYFDCQNDITLWHVTSWNRIHFYCSPTLLFKDWSWDMSISDFNEAFSFWRGGCRAGTNSWSGWGQNYDHDERTRSC